MPSNPNHSRFFWRSSAMMATLNFNCQFKEVNAAWEKHLGLSTGALLAKSMLDFVHKDDRQAIEYYFEQLTQGSISTSFSCRFLHHNGSYKHILWEVTSAASKEDAFYIVGMDISGRERPSVADEIISVLEEGVVLQYANGTVGACNPSAERILGLKADQMIGWTLVDPDWQLLKEDGTPFPNETHPAICTLRTGKAYSDIVMGVERPDSRVLWLRLNTYPLWRDEITPYAVVISFSDISHYKNVEYALRDQADNQQHITKPYHEKASALWEWDLISQEVQFPQSWNSILGYSDEKMPAHIDSWYAHIHPMDYKRVLADMQSHLEGDAPEFESSHRVQHKDGSYRWIHSHGKALRNEQHKAIKFVGLHIDITEDQQTEHALKSHKTKYQYLMDTESSAVILVHTETDNITEVNRATMQIYGYGQDELLKMKRAELSAQSEKGLLYQRRAICQIRRRHHKNKNGHVFPVEVITNPLVLQGQDYLLLIVRNITESQQLETSLWESQSKYRQLFEASSDAIVVFDANTQQVFDVNNVAINLYGYSKDEWLNLTTTDLSAEPIKSRNILYSGKRQKVIPLRWHKKKDGMVFPVEIAVGGSYLFQGRSLVCATLRDITERKASEEALNSERDFVQTLVHASPTFYIALNPDGTMRMVNTALLTTLGYVESDLLKKDFFTTLIPETKRNIVAAEFEILTKTMCPSLIEFPVICKDGQTRNVEWHSRAIIKSDGALDYLFSVGIDMTDRKQTQENLRLFQTILEVSEEALIVTGTNGELVYSNPAYYHLFGCQADAVQIQYDNMYPPAAQKILNNDIKPALQRGESWVGELDVWHHDGTEFPIWQRSDSVRDAQGNTLFKFELMHDISERKRMWEALRSQWNEYQQLFNNVPVMIWHRDSQNRLLRANQAATDTFEDLDDWFVSDNALVLSTGEVVIEWLEIPSKNNLKKRSLQVSRVPYLNKKGLIDGVIIFALELKEAKALTLGHYKLANQDEPLVKLLARLPLMVQALDESGRFVSWNAHCEKVTGYQANQVLGEDRMMQKLYPDADQLKLMRNRYGESTWEGRIRCHNEQTKHIKWINVSAQIPINGWYTWHIGEVIVKDNNMMNKQFLTQLHSQELAGLLFETTQIGICITDERGRFVQTNTAYTNIFGYEKNALTEQPFTIVFPKPQHEAKIREYFRRIKSHEQVKYFDMLLGQHRDGTIFDLLGLSQRVLLDDGRWLLIGFYTPKMPDETLQ